MDADLRYVAANRVYQERFGRAREQIVGQLVAEVTGPASEDVVPYLRAALAGEPQYLEPRMISIDGYRILSVTHLPYRNSDGAVVGVIVYGYDITEQRRAEAALLQSEKLAAVGRLASSIAHEINNPLAAVVNLLYLIELTALQDGEKALEFTRLAQRELARVSQITTQTLRFFKQSTSQRETDIPELIDSVLALNNAKLLTARIHVLREYEANAKARCFDGEVRQAVNNLIGNAIDSMSSGNDGGQLRVRARRSIDFITNQPCIRVTIADQGEGMSAAVQARIFEPFFTTKGQLGTGLGMWITQELITKRKGRLKLRSKRMLPSNPDSSHGTVVALLLPINFEG